MPVSMTLGGGTCGTGGRSGGFGGGSLIPNGFRATIGSYGFVEVSAECRTAVTAQTAATAKPILRLVENISGNIACKNRFTTGNLLYKYFGCGYLQVKFPLSRRSNTPRPKELHSEFPAPPRIAIPGLVSRLDAFYRALLHPGHQRT